MNQDLDGDDADDESDTEKTEMYDDPNSELCWEFASPWSDAAGQ